MAQSKIEYKDLECRYKLLHDLMEHSPDVIYFKDKEGRLLMVNEAHAQGLGLMPEEVIGKTDYDIHPKERAAKMMADDLCVMNTGKPIIDKVERGTRTDGVDNYVSTTKIPRYDKDGNIIGLIGISRDITHRMRLERLQHEKIRIEKKLETQKDLNRMKSEFVSIVSHELRTPLAIIKEALDLVLEGLPGGLNDHQKKLLSTAKSSASRLNSLIEDLLDLSRIERGTLRLRYSLVDLNEVINEHTDFFKKQADEKGIILNYIMPREHMNIFVDPERITQIISNLITNAIKYTEQGGNISVDVKTLEDKMRIGVLDTGIGISPEDLPKLFRKFVQVSHTGAAEKKGVGLGLSITRELVEKHGGDIWVESKPGVGSKFYFTLPKFYTASALNDDMRDEINILLNRDIPIYLINILIINYREFKRRFRDKSLQLFKDLDTIINTTSKEHLKSDKEKMQIVLKDTKNGECGIVLPEATEKKAATMCNALKEKIERYFLKHKIEDIFVNLGVFSHPQKLRRPYTTKQLFANLNIKKIFIGSNTRQFDRVRYNIDIELFLPKEKRETSSTVDISEGGVCFVSRHYLETDAKIDIKLAFPKKKPIYTKGRIAWVRPMGDPSQTATDRKYKVGLEFLSIKSRDRKTITQLIKKA